LDKLKARRNKTTFYYSKDNFLRLRASLAHFNISKWPLYAAAEHVSSFQLHPLFLAHCALALRVALQNF
jgi:hypothetical protein